LTNYQYAFGGKGWTDETFKPKYLIQPTGSNGNYMFRNGGVQIPDLSNVDFSKCGGVVQMFSESAVTELGVLNFSAVGPGWGGINQTFHTCRNLKKIEQIILPNYSIKISEGFVSCSGLEEIRFKGTIYEQVNFQWSPLSVESMKNIISCLKNYSGTSSEFTKRVIFKDTCWEALEADSAAPDGGTWLNYVASLGWNT
jgi:hypothetical protein